MQKQNNIMKWLSYTVKGCKEDYIDVENIYVPNMQDYLIRDEEVTQLQEGSLSNIVPPQDIKESDEYINIAKSWIGFIQMNLHHRYLQICLLQK